MIQRMLEDRNAGKNSKNFSAFFPFPRGKKGMEMWQLVIIVLAIIFFLVMFIWYGVLGENLGDLFSKMRDLF